MSHWQATAPTLFLVAPPRTETNAEQDGARLTLQRWATHEKWEFRFRRTISYRISQGANTGRRLQVMEPQDAGELYRLTHRHPTAVIQIGSPTVLLDPASEPSERNLISLERFVRYKAFFRMLGREGPQIDVANFLGDFQNWRQRHSCNGERDARCIPLHVFCPSCEWKDLHDIDGVKRFESSHGQANARIDERDRNWNPPKKARHGRESAIVAGIALPSGFHWDVVSPRGAGRLCTSTEVWKFTRGSYCNVYPDAAVRQGQRKGSRARLVYEARRPDDTLASGTRSQRPEGQRRSRYR